MEKVSDIKKIVIAVLLWRVILFVFSFVADNFLLYSPSFPYYDQFLSIMNIPRWLYSWGNFDGVHYITIAQEGYKQAAFIQAFFPTFPLLISLFHNTLLGGLLLNIFFMVGICFFLYFLHRKTEKNIWWTLIVFLSFPTSLFFGALYNEALFLFLVLGSFTFASKKQWFWAAFMAGIASGTRVVGIALFPALILELWLDTYPEKWFAFSLKNILFFFQKRWKELLMMSLSGLGLLSYMLYLFLTYHDPLSFFHVQEGFGAGRQDSLVTFPQVVWRYYKILTTVPFDWKFFSYLQELFFSLGTLGLLILGWKKIRPSYLLFAFFAFFIPPLTGTFSSMPRYILVCFPIFFILGDILSKSKIARYCILPLFWVLLFLNTVLYIQGYWVA